MDTANLPGRTVGPTVTSREECYRALLERRPEYEGLFYVGVKTTGVFCRPTCPARKPKLQNCEFFATAREALLASYRPCRRCRPLSPVGQVSELVRMLVEAVEADPEKRWRDNDFRDLGVDVSTARRHFKKRFGMTFVEYARARRIGLAMKQIRDGGPVIEAQVAAGYESGSGFRDAFSQILGVPPSRAGQHEILQMARLDTPLGPMLAISSEEALLLLEFLDRRGLEREIERLRCRRRAAVIPGRTEVIASIEMELAGYFEGNLQRFETPLQPPGSAFQQEVWRALLEIPFGETCSYTQLAGAIGRPRAFRAVARANGANQIAIAIPCHRVINASGELGGYGGGLTRKAWLLAHEAETKSEG